MVSTRRPGGTLPATDVARFLEKARSHAIDDSSLGSGRLIFALDATMSRQPTWDLACSLQYDLFDAASKNGNLHVKLAYFRGQAEARASRWFSDPASLKAAMARISCQGGLTQISRILDHAVEESKTAPLSAMVYVGDTCEEDVDQLCGRAGELALRNTRAFMFLEGDNRQAEQAYREIARITGGVFLRFDPAAAEKLRALLSAIGTYATGGRAALEARDTREARLLLENLRR